MKQLSNALKGLIAKVRVLFSPKSSTKAKSQAVTYTKKQTKHFKKKSKRSRK